MGFWAPPHVHFRRQPRRRGDQSMSITRGDAHALCVNLFGGPRVEASGRPVSLSPLQLALVTLVYGHGRGGIARPRAARLLWGSEADTDARHRIRQLLLDVRTK